MFDPEIRISWLGSLPDARFDPEYCEPRDVDIPITVSLLTPGVGVRFGTEQEGMFRFGVRPELVLSPHLDNNSTFYNNFDDINLGVEQWVVPEFLLEYRKCDWTVGVAYKWYNIQANDPMYGPFTLAKLNTISLYGKYKGFVLGYNFFSESNEFDKGNYSWNDNQTLFKHDNSFIAGYAYPF
ncbi:MAG: hypothetical protein WCW17_03135 [Patescibacteria group bacterium]